MCVWTEHPIRSCGSSHFSYQKRDEHKWNLTLWTHGHMTTKDWTHLKPDESAPNSRGIHVPLSKFSRYNATCNCKDVSDIWLRSGLHLSHLPSLSPYQQPSHLSFNAICPLQLTHNIKRSTNVERSTMTMT